MRLSMLKLLMITSLLSTSSFAIDSKVDQKILKIEERKIERILKRRPDINFNGLELILKKDLNYEGWYGYAFNLKLSANGKSVVQKHFVFSNGTMLAPELINLKTNRSFKDMVYPKLSKNYFDKKHLIAGNADAKHTLVLFSDPLCPICLDEVPDIINKVKQNPSQIALYYFHMPLDMHPTARTLSKASMILTSRGVKDVDYRVYKTDFSNFFDAYEQRDQYVALRHFNRIFKTNISMAEINDPKWNNKLMYDLKMAEDAFVNGTPTLFLDGEIDKSRTKFEQYLK